jgi:hypothetical protein
MSRQGVFDRPNPRGINAQIGNPEGATTPPIRHPWEGVTTPPIPSSSPAGGADAMDMSPLPHKIPFPSLSKPIDSPCRKAVIDDDMISPTDPTPIPQLESRNALTE